MHQELVQANCPHCCFGVELFSPALDRKVTVVVAIKSWWCESRHTTSEHSCPSCKRPFYLVWSFEPVRNTAVVMIDEAPIHFLGAPKRSELRALPAPRLKQLEQ